MMGITRVKSIEESPNKKLPTVIELNVGGSLYTTRLCTLRKYPDSLLAAMFSGKYKLDRDEAYRIFIDRDGTHFGYILNWLRDDDLPPPSVLDHVMREARFYGLQALVNILNNYPMLLVDGVTSHTTFYNSIKKCREREDTMKRCILILSCIVVAILFSGVGYGFVNFRKLMFEQ